MYIIHSFIQELQTFREVLENICNYIYTHLYTVFYWILVLSAKEHSLFLNIINTTE